MDNRNEQIRDGSTMNGRMGPSFSNRQDRPDKRPVSDPDGRMMGPGSTRPLDRPGFQGGQPRPYGEEIDGRRSPPRRISLEDTKDKVGTKLL